MQGHTTIASDWKGAGQRLAEAAAVDLELPSGVVIRARRPDPLQLAMWGNLPLALAPPDAAAAGGEGAFLSTAQFARDMLSYCCVSPRISLDPKDMREIHPRDIPMEDTMFILRWAARGEEQELLRSFRAKRQRDSAGGDGGDVGDAAERTPGDPGSGDGAGDRPGDRGGADTVQAEG